LTGPVQQTQGSKSKVGHPQNLAWKHFIQTPLAIAEHFAAKCCYCEKIGHKDDHKTFKYILLKKCLKVVNDIRRYFI
jgi:hypothetical protein